MSWLALTAGCLAGAELTRRGLCKGGPLTAIVTSGYMFWSIFWGLPPFWGWWRRNQGPVTSLVGHLCHRQSAGFFAVSLATQMTALSAGIWFSLVGGGIFHFVRAWRAHGARP